MALKINLLAEFQAQEEARRKDPVKRAIYAGIGLVVVTLLWIVLNQFKISSARSEVVGIEGRLRKVEEASRTVRANELALGNIQHNLNSLESYSTNRFFWGTFLDALQGVVVGNIRLMEIKSQQQSSSHATNLLYTTNVIVPFTPIPSWKFWAGEAQIPLPQTVLSNTFKTITNRPPFTTNLLRFVSKAAITLTNTFASSVTVQLDFVSVGYSMEQLVITITGRDYSASGSSIDEFTRRLAAAPYFAQRLGSGEGQGLHVERMTQPRPDPNDLDNPTGMFIPFTVECRFEPRILTNE